MTKTEKLWLNQGGSFHGPNVETGTMPKDKLIQFIEGMQEQILDREKREELAVSIMHKVLAKAEQLEDRQLRVDYADVYTIVFNALK